MAIGATSGQQSTEPKKKSLKKWLLVAGICLAGLVVLLVAYGIWLSKGPGVDKKTMELSAQLTDQPAPIPSSNQANTTDDYCQIITPQIAEELGATGKPLSIGGIIAGCDVPLAGGALIQISSVGPYSRLSPADEPHFAAQVTVAGLEGRIYNLGAPLNGECTLNLNTRSVNSIIINVRWYGPNDLVRATKRAESCTIAQKAGEVLAKAYVPLAGGTPYTKTLQQPAATAIVDYPCRIVDGPAALAGEVYDVSDDRSGKQQARSAQAGSCSYEAGGNKAVITLDKSGKDLGSLPVVRSGAQTTSRKLGILPARQSEADNMCSLSVELQPGTILDVTYTGSASGASACKLAEVMQARAVYNLINATSVGM